MVEWLPLRKSAAPASWVWEWMPLGNNRSNSSRLIWQHIPRSREGQFSQGGPRPRKGDRSAAPPQHAPHWSFSCISPALSIITTSHTRDVKKIRGNRVFLNPQIRTEIAMAMVAHWRLRSHQIALCGFRACALLLILWNL